MLVRNVVRAARARARTMIIIISNKCLLNYLGKGDKNARCCLAHFCALENELKSSDCTVLVGAHNEAAMRH